MAAKKKAPPKKPPQSRSKRGRGATEAKREAKSPHEPTPQTRAIVERLSLTGKLTHDDIGAVIGISDVTLRKHYAHELATSKGKTTAAVLNSYLENCIGTRGQAARLDADGKVIVPAVPGRPGDVNAQKFYLERFLGMNQKTETELSGSVKVSGPNLAALSDDELDQLEALNSRMAGKPASPN